MRVGHIVVAGRLGTVTTLSAVTSRLRAIGHRVTVFDDASGATLADADVAVAAPGFRCSRDVLASAPRLRGVVSPITGVEGIDVAAASELGIIVANGQTRENTESMAEATILLVLAALYDLHGTEAVLRDHLPRPLQMNARMLRGKTVGLIGYGAISRAVVARLAGWNVVLQACTRRVPEDVPAEVRFIDLDTLMQTSDVVCVLASLNSESRGMLDGRRLRLLRHGAVLINTARGAVIDEAALYQVASERPDLRLALDTFTVEPLPAGSPLRGLRNAILTPHMVGHTQESETLLPDVAVENVTRILRGELPVFVCNPAVADRWRMRWPGEPWSHPAAGRPASSAGAAAGL